MRSKRIRTRLLPLVVFSVMLPAGCGTLSNNDRDLVPVVVELEDIVWEEAVYRDVNGNSISVLRHQADVDVDGNYRLIATVAVSHDTSITNDDVFLISIRTNHPYLLFFEAAFFSRDTRLAGNKLQFSPNSENREGFDGAYVTFIPADAVNRCDRIQLQGVIHR